MAEEQKLSKVLAVGVWFTLLVFSFLTSGIVFGWPALVLILNDEGLYTEMCPQGQLNCEDRQLRLSLVFSAGFFCLLGGRLLWGLLLDRAGPRCTSSLAALIIALGAALFSIAKHIPWDFTHILAYALIGFGGPGIHLANFHSSNLFPSRKRTVTASYSGVFGTSGLVFVLFRAAYSAGVDFETLWAVYAVVAVCIAVGYLVVQPKRTLKVGDSLTLDKCSLTVVHPEKESTGLQANAEPASVLGAVLHWKMIGLGMFFGVSFLHLQFYLGQAEEMLDKLGDRETGNTFLLAFNIIGSSALAIFVPVGMLLDKASFHVSFTLCNALAIVFNVVSLVDSLQLQVVGFICWCVSRMILFAGFFSFIPAVVGFPRFGITSGVLSTGSAIVGLLNIPLSKVALEHTHKPVMIGLLVAQMLMFAFPAALFMHARREQPKAEVQSKTVAASLPVQDDKAAASV